MGVPATHIGEGAGRSSSVPPQHTLQRAGGLRLRDMGDASVGAHMTGRHATHNVADATLGGMGGEAVSIGNGPWRDYTVGFLWPLMLSEAVS